MAYEEKTKPVKPHILSMDDRCKMTVTGVEDVESFDENEINLLTSRGSMSVRGSGLHIGKINLDQGELKVEGLINELVYEEASPSESVWSRLFG